MCLAGIIALLSGSEAKETEKTNHCHYEKQYPGVLISIMLLLMVLALVAGICIGKSCKPDDEDEEIEICNGKAKRSLSPRRVPVNIRETLRGCDSEDEFDVPNPSVHRRGRTALARLTCEELREMLSMMGHKGHSRFTKDLLKSTIQEYNYETFLPDHRLVSNLHRLADHGVHVPPLAFLRTDVAVATLRQRRSY